ncbi:MFS transporter [Massilia pseudoviolaceinigra]|uniref:MFS transporter n=1 Tax=Massilia pseudoviolaceinigra TaxID=3057165 RepID=UPI00279670C4|nr:MFS transporter [Massilia sp. CCM 9206]MDQ1922849.1 MFS transporter [Massilia sp. CCM 9206]
MSRLSLPMLLSYGLFGLPLAMVALPIYVYLPQFYAGRAGLSLALIGAVLLTARVAAAFIDPLLGWWIERGQGAYARYVALSLPVLLAGFVALFHPPPLGSLATMAWFLGALMLVYVGFSIATIAHQSWGAALTQAPLERARVTGVREACGLVGVVLAAAVTGQAGYGALSVAFAVALAVGGALLLARAARPTIGGAPAARPGWRAMTAPFREAPFRALFAVLIVNGIASAIPATLFLFFAADRLQLGAMSGLFLIVYFGAAAASMPLWIGAAARFGEARAWAAGMLLAAAVFVWAFGLGAGSGIAFGVICLLSGLALGADLALPPALLAGVIGAAGHAGGREAAYFGVWNWGVQMTLALAAGIALPLLAWLGYVPGAGGGTTALAAAYALLPCALKLLAAAMLWRAPLRHC